MPPYRMTTAEILDALDGITEERMNLARASLLRGAARDAEARAANAPDAASLAGQQPATAKEAS